MMGEPWRWALAFGFTQACEVPLYLRATRSLRVSFLASAFTHPVVWFAFPLVQRLGAPWWLMVALAECFAVAVEGLWLRRHGVRRAFAWSLAANAASAALGLLSRAAFGLP